MTITMYNEKAALYGGIIALITFAILVMVLCIVCKLCLNSKKLKRCCGLDKMFADSGQAKSDNERAYAKNIASRESDLMLKMQQGDYVGYDAFEKDITISKLPLSVSKEGLNYKQDVDVENRKQDTVFGSKVERDDNLDMTTLKSSSQSASNRHRTGRHNGHSFHNSYTIYEEGSDLSGNEAGANSICSLHSSADSLNKLHTEDTQKSKTESSGDLTHSDSCRSLGPSLEVLEISSDSGLGQVEYSLRYHRDNGQLVLHIIRARELDLPCGADGSLPDTFIKTFASDCHDRDPKKQTKICKATTNPTFEENFIFRVDVTELETGSITLQVFSRDHYARQRLVGEICIELSSLLITDVYRTWSNVLDYDHQPMSSCADVRVRLEHDAASQTLSVSLSKLRDLKLITSPLYKSKEIYMAVTLLTSDDRRVRKKTSTHSIATGCHATLLDTHDLTFTLTNQTTHESKLVIELCEEYPDKSHGTIGYTILGSGSTDTEYGHWSLMHSAQVQQPVTMWHRLYLRPNQPQYKQQVIR